MTRGISDRSALQRYAARPARPAPHQSATRLVRRRFAVGAAASARQTDVTRWLCSSAETGPPEASPEHPTVPVRSPLPSQRASVSDMPATKISSRERLLIKAASQWRPTKRSDLTVKSSTSCVRRTPREEGRLRSRRRFVTLRSQRGFLPLAGPAAVPPSCETEATGFGHGAVVGAFGSDAAACSGVEITRAARRSCSGRRTPELVILCGQAMLPLLQRSCRRYESYPERRTITGLFGLRSPKPRAGLRFQSFG